MSRRSEADERPRKALLGVGRTPLLGLAPGRVKPGLLAAAAACLLVGAVAGWIARGAPPESVAPRKIAELRDPGARYTSPLLDCDVAVDALDNHILQPFRFRVEEVIKRATESRHVGEASVYFRDLNNGPWFSISPRSTFIPASLTKLPILIAFLKRSESDPGLLSRQVIYPPGGPDLNLIQTFKPEVHLTPGKAYLVEELLERLIEHSDNNALPLLRAFLSGDEIERTLSAMGVGFTRHLSQSGAISAEDYAAFFRILYNASYLSRENSEKALRMLASTDYPGGLRPGVPPEVEVSHKFGEHMRPAGEAFPRQLHDCGIVYAPLRPYLLCVMTRGDNFEALSGFITEVSRTVYASVTSQPPSIVP